MSTHPYEYTHIHPILMNISEELSRLHLKIHKIGYQKYLIVDRDVVSH
jgi:hypothetical protein